MSAEANLNVTFIASLAHGKGFAATLWKIRRSMSHFKKILLSLFLSQVLKATFENRKLISHNNKISHINKIERFWAVLPSYAFQQMETSAEGVRAEEQGDCSVELRLA